MNAAPFRDLLFHTALKGTAVLVVALLLGLALHRMAAARRYALWITTMATLALLPLAMGLLPAWHVLPKASGEMEWPVMETPQFSINAEPALTAGSSRAIQPAAGAALPVQAPAQTAFSWNISWQDVVENIPLAWMLVACGLLLRLALSAWRLRHLESSLHPGACPMLEQAARELGLRRSPLLLIGPADSVPMVWGVFRPRLLLPQGFESWPHEKQRGVLLHELAHLKRGDPLALWLAQWVKALHWFNPLAWLTLRQLRADQERACDDAVMRQGVRASDYAQSLLDLSRHNRIAPGLSLCALTITRCAPVEGRVKAILDPVRRREGPTLRWLAGIAGCALLFALPVAMLQAIEGPVLRGRILDRNGVVLAESTKEKVRVYPLKTLAAHMVGYVRTPDQKHAQIYGGAGLEVKQDAALAAGRDVALTLDARIQALTMQAMKDGGVERGATVMLDPRTGEILASVSLPSFDPNDFIPSISHENWDRYLKDQDIPLFNRCFRGLYPPASTFTLLTAMAGFSTGLRNEHYQCTGSVTYGTRVLQCWKGVRDETGHGTLDLKGAVRDSCNCYWYQFGNATRVGAFEKLFDALGFNQNYGLVSHESTAILPSEAQLKKGSPSQGQVNMANLAIGQGLTLLSPVHLGILAATVANGGKVPQPSLMKRQATMPWHVELADQGVTADSMELLRQGMRAVVNDPAGTGKSAKSDKVVIAAKTGTAQWKLSSDQKLGLMIGFAPYDQPQIAFAVIYEGRSGEAVSGGALCGPVIKRIVEETLALPADGSGEVKPVEDEVTPLKQAQIEFDSHAEEIRREFQLLFKERSGTCTLKQIDVRHGRVTIFGEAVEMAAALGFKDALPQIAKKWEMEWSFPVPQPLEDGKRVKFMAEGVCKGSVENAAPSKTKTTTSDADRSIVMDPQVADLWKRLKRKGWLADLPAEAIVLDGNTERLEQYLPGTHRLFRFSLPQEAARRWLEDSIFVEGQREKLLRWPRLPASLNGTFTAANNCTVIVSGVNGETVQVVVFQRSIPPDEPGKNRPFQKPRPFRPILIAPDESQEPLPAGRLAPEYHGKGFTQAEAMPTLEVALPTLRPEISPQEVPLPTFRPEPGQHRLRVAEPLSVSLPQLPHPVDRFKGELSEESQKAITRSYRLTQMHSLLISSRMQQALIVKPPKA
ncbi:penicillin-binding transpeptidase domain-containing protein [Prosthecobacter vanneervenii]|uniref:Cell division protein FtsI/penicillin-binding protein 2 n=1 Tax=Prosthecobacter vanneervenii TaxID=48466 RepID=A0A7W8DLM3_9BACT|nr:penicillin-binding transpeptidase domain-containing protein [Prosthecobacter vanneervenii]MBB5034458.1 cell division protein FtsI/penicillin-binding protein 2 [Prosthecobacter vanneervenii]